jgi:hypothetical protein
MRRDKSLLAIGATLTDIEEAIAEFYAGEYKRLDFVESGVWRVISPITDRQLPGVRVRLHKSVYRFEMVPMP